MTQFIALTDLAAGDPTDRPDAPEKQEPEVRKATQEDIDRFFGGF